MSSLAPGMDNELDEGLSRRPDVGRGKESAESVLGLRGAGPTELAERGTTGGVIRSWSRLLLCRAAAVSPPSRVYLGNVDMLAVVPAEAMVKVPFTISPTFVLSPSS